MTSIETSIVVGSPVYAADGDMLGEVKRVSGDLFEVDASMEPDYWLSPDAVASASSAAVTLSIRGDQVDGYKVAGPDPDPQ
jgi:hypothetical protein